MKKALLACTAMLLLAGVAPVAAETAKPATAEPAKPAMAPSAGPNFDAQIQADEARIAQAKVELALNADQAKKWPAVETAIRAYYKDRIDRMKKIRDPIAMQDPLNQLKDRSEMMAQSADSLKKFAAAIEPLYKTLEPPQKRALVNLTTNQAPMPRPPVAPGAQPPGVQGKPGAPMQMTIQPAQTTPPVPQPAPKAQ